MSAGSEEQLQGFALSPQQERLWWLQNRASTLFRARAAVEIRGAVDVPSLEGALRDLVGRYEILRTAFRSVSGLEMPVQVIAEAAGPVLERVPKASSSGTVEKLLSSWQAPGSSEADLGEGSLLRAGWAELDSERALLLLDLPSLSADVESLDVLAGLISEAYAARRGAATGEGEEEILQYADIAAWQCELLGDEDDSRAGRRSWRPAVSPRLDLRIGVESVERGSAGPVGYLTAPLASGLRGRLEHLASSQGVQLQAVLLAAWHLVLARRAGGSEMTVGVLLSGRQGYEELERALGPLAKALPVTARFGEISFSHLVRNLDERLTEAAEEVEAFFWDPSQPVSGVSFFPYLFECRELPAPVMTEGVRFQPLLGRARVERCFAGLHVVLDGESLRAEVSHDETVLSAVSARRLLDAWVAVLDQVAAAPEKPLGAIDVLGERERHELLVEAADGGTGSPEASFPELFARQAQRTPEAVAARFQGRSLSYAELEARASRLARRLRGLGVGPEQRVALELGRSLEMLVAVLGTLRSGAAYLPLDPGLPEERREWMLTESGAQVVLTSTLPERREDGRLWIRLDEAASSPSEAEAELPEGFPSLDQLAYVIYTSGSTGRPKGVMISHRGLAAYLVWSSLAYGGETGSLVHSPLSFDLTVTSLLAPLVRGGMVELLPEERGIAHLSRGLVAASGRRLLKLTPAHLDLLTTLHGGGELAGKVSVMVLGGEALRRESVKKWQALDPQTRIVNEYGPTETVVGCSIHEPTAGERGDGSVPIGRPIPGARLFLLDRSYRPVPFGGEGEIFIGGLGVARGYLGRPRQSAERFLPDPFSSRQGERLYRTGDLGRWRADGDLEFRGRIDTQVKLHGYRIELGEIEEVLAECPPVREAVVVLRNDPSSGASLLVAYFLPGEIPATVGELRAFLEKRLPEYMIPGAFEKVSSWPLTPNGKIDRDALPDWRHGDTGRAASYVAPRNLAEEVLADVWAEVLGRERVGAEDDFFQLGGDSILAITALTKIHERGFELSPLDFFDCPVLCDLAHRAMISGSDALVPGEPVAPFALISQEDRERLPAGVEDAYPLARLQAGMLFHSAIGERSAVYHDLTSFRVRAKLDPRALRTVLEGLLAGHEVLRTSFLMGELSVPLQLVRERVPLPLRVEDLRHLSPAEQEEELTDWRAREKLQPFDPTCAPLIRFHVHVLSPETFELTLSYHHAIVDGWSVASLLTAMFRHYAALVRGELYRPSERSPFAYRDFIDLEKKTMVSKEIRERWRQELDGHVPLHLPVRESVREDLPVEIRGEPIVVGDELAAALVRRASAEKVPLKSLLLAIHFEVLGRLSQQSDLLSGVVTHGRPEVPGGERLIGLFLNTLPMRIRRLEGTWSQLLKEVFDRERQLMPLRRYPLAEIQSQLKVRDLVQTVFNFVHFHIYRQVSPSEDVEILSGEFFEETNFPLAVSFMFDAAAGMLRGRIDYDAVRLEPSLIERMAKYYVTFLDSVAQSPESFCHRVSPLSEAERQQLLLEWSGSVEEAPFESLQDRFASWASRRGEAVAVIGSGGALTYGELNRRADRLAGLLQSRGVGPETVVGVLCGRTPAVATAFLAILKAGGVYLPLDLSYPERHLTYMLETSATSLLLSTEEPMESLAATGIDWIKLAKDGELGGAVAEVPEAPARPSLSPDSAAYLIFTSGSTGRPKGVVLCHRGLSNLAAWQSRLFGVEPESRVLLFAALSFDASVSEMGMAFWAGASLALGSREELFPGPRLVERLRSLEVSHVTLPPTALAILPVVELPALRSLVSAGEACPGALSRRWASSHHFFNAYGPTEVTVCATLTEIDAGEARPPIGRALPNLRIYVLDPWMQPVPAGLAGELFVGGVGVGRGYLGRPKRTARSFVPDPFSGLPGARLYSTGDQVRYRDDGQLDYLGRIDRQVKVRGFRIEPGEVERQLAEYPGVREAAVVTRSGSQDDVQLVAYAVPTGEEPSLEEIRGFLLGRLPEHMVPARIVFVEAFPLTPSGKVDRRALTEASATAERPRLETELVKPRNEIERAIGEIVGDVLGIREIGLDDNLFDLGGHSIHLLQIQSKLREHLGFDLPLMDLFEHPTVRSLARFQGAEPRLVGLPEKAARERSDEIAIIGMAGRFPGASHVGELWENLKAGRESITFFTKEELRSAGVDRASIENPSYVPAKAVLEGVEEFDASFFGLTPREADLMDPQHRVFLETSWRALESAGYDPAGCGVPVGVFAGSSTNSYMFQLMANPEVVESLGAFQAVTSNDKDFLPTLVSYKLGLEGPSVAVQTACSSSLVAVHMACRSLLSGECEMALAGGVSVRLPQVAGHLHVEGGIDSPDGHCRPYDAAARGTVAGNGVGVVVLKPLRSALADGDHVLAVVKGSAINNDGSEKVGFTAPRIEGQARVVRAAHLASGVDADTISYVEGHGTGTQLGDPIEVAALIRAFRASTDRSRFCGLGSVKGNVGHLDAAAGVTGLIKTVLALVHESIPPTLHFQEPNPEIPFDGSPFYVVGGLRPWLRDGGPRRAGVSSFGIGGTNAHVVLEEAPLSPSTTLEAPSTSCLLPLSARTPEALERMTAELAQCLEESPALELGDVAYTLQTGRRSFSHRRLWQVADRATAVKELRDPLSGRHSVEETNERPIAFLFPGQGAQHPDMARGLYERMQVFRDEVDRCSELIQPLLGFDLRQVLFPGSVDEAAWNRLGDTAVTQPALFIVEYALARLWMSWGVGPQAFLGHSVGEYVAACLAGVFELPDVLRLVVKRGELTAGLPPGSMLGIRLSVEELGDLPEGVEVAAVNGPRSTVLSGPPDVVSALAERLSAAGTSCRRLHTSHAFHSAMMEPILEAFGEVVERTRRQPPQRPFLSNVTGTWIRADEAIDPGYWVRHLRRTVRFDDGLKVLLGEPERVLLEVGPSQILSALARRHPKRRPHQFVLASLPEARDKGDAVEHLLATLGQLWLSGHPVPWQNLHKTQPRVRVPLPSYSFDRRRHWVEAAPQQWGRQLRPTRAAVGDWLHTVSWLRERGSLLRPAPPPANEGGGCYLLFCDAEGLGRRLASRLRELGEVVATVASGEGFLHRGGLDFEIAPGEAADYARLFAELAAEERTVSTVLHLWNSEPAQEDPLGEAEFREAQERGLFSLAHLGRHLALLPTAPRRLLVAASGLYDPLGGEGLCVARSTLQGPCLVMPQEIPQLWCRVVDLGTAATHAAARDGLAERLLAELARGGREPAVAYRGNSRWRPVFESLETGSKSSPAVLRPQGVYLLLGGLGNIGLTVAERLAQEPGARLLLTRRSPFPAPEEWSVWLAEHDEHDAVSATIRRLQRLSELGAEVRTAAFDLADEEALRLAVEETERRWGRIDGVLHCAGVVGEQTFCGLDELNREEIERQLAAKVYGSRALARVLGERPLDFCLLFSSLASSFGGLGFTAYAAANAFQDALAEAQRQRGLPWTAVDWDGWSFDGEPASASTTITPEEGVRAFDLVLERCAISRILVSTTDPESRLRRSLVRAAAPTETADAAPTAASLHPRPGLSTPYVPATDEVERKLVRIWSDLLGIERIGVRDNFFELGGHSLLATQLSSRLREVFGSVVPLRQIFESPTITELAVALGSAGTETESDLPPIEPVPRGASLELSFAQQRLWFLHQLEGAEAYNTFTGLRLLGRLDRRALERSLSEIVRRHEVLRTTVESRDGRAFQVVHPARSFTLPEVDLRRLPASRRDAAARQRAEEHSRRRYDLERGPLVRFLILRMADDESILCLSMHHIVCDGWSVGVFVREVSALYAAFRANQSSPLVELPVQYADYAAWQHRVLDEKTRGAQLRYWTEQLAGPPTVEMPLDHPRPAVLRHRGATAGFDLDLETSQRLRSFAQEHEVTVFMVLLGVFNVLLYLYTGQEDLVVGTNVAGRRRRELEGLIGFFVNNLTLRTQLAGDISFLELLRRTREMTLEAYAHQDVPFELVVDALHPERDTSRHPLFQILFVLQIEVRDELHLPGVTVSSFDVEKASSAFDLLINLQEHSKGIRGTAEYNRELFEPASIRLLLDRYRELLANVLGDPEQVISALSWSSRIESVDEINAFMMSLDEI